MSEPVTRAELDSALAQLEKSIDTKLAQLLTSLDERFDTKLERLETRLASQFWRWLDPARCANARTEPGFLRRKLN